MHIAAIKFQFVRNEHEHMLISIYVQHGLSKRVEFDKAIDYTHAVGSIPTHVLHSHRIAPFLFQLYVFICLVLLRREEMHMLASRLNRNRSSFTSNQLISVENSPLNFDRSGWNCNLCIFRCGTPADLRYIFVVFLSKMVSISKR